MFPVFDPRLTNIVLGLAIGLTVSLIVHGVRLGWH